MNLAAPVGVFQNVFRHRYCLRLDHLRPRWRAELEPLRIELRVELFLVEPEGQHGLIEAGHLHLPNREVRGHHELHGGIGKVVGGGFRRDPLAVPFGARFNVLELLLEVQLAEQEGKRCAHVFAFLELHLLRPVVGRSVEPEELAIADEQLALGLRILPAHAPGFAQLQRAASPCAAAGWAAHMFH